MWGMMWLSGPLWLLWLCHVVAAVAAVAALLASFWATLNQTCEKTRFEHFQKVIRRSKVQMLGSNLSLQKLPSLICLHAFVVVVRWFCCSFTYLGMRTYKL